MCAGHISSDRASLTPPVTPALQHGILYSRISQFWLYIYNGHSLMVPPKSAGWPLFARPGLHVGREACEELAV